MSIKNRFWVILVLVCSVFAHQTVFSQQHGIIASSMQTTATFTGLLDDVPGAAFAIGTRKLDKDYTGQCIRIVRASDSGEQDIGFSGQDIDEAAINSFCSGTTCYVGKAYDQSGNSRDALGNGYPTQTNLPIIYESGAIYKINGKAAFKITHPRTFQFTLSGTNLADLATPGSGGAKQVTTHMVGLQGSASSTPYKIIIDPGSGSSVLWFYENSGSERIEFFSYASAMGATWTDDVQKHWVWQVNGNPLDIYQNGTDIGGGTVGGTATDGTSGGTTWNIGGLSFSSRDMEGGIQEIAIWKTVQSVSTLYSNSNGYYSFP